MNIPCLTLAGAILAIDDLVNNGIPDSLIDDLSGRALWLVWFYFIGQQERSKWN